MRVDGDLGDGLGVLVGGHLDLDAALDGGDAEVVAVGPVDEEGEVVLLGDVGRRGDQHPVDGVALDVHAEDLAGLGDRVLRVLGQLDAAGLAAAADLDLRLDDHPASPLASAAAAASSGSVTTVPRVTGTPCLAKSSFAWYSIRSTIPHPSPGCAGRRDETGLSVVVPRFVPWMRAAKVQYFTATTLDGFIADADNSLDWLFVVERDEDDVVGRVHRRRRCAGDGRDDLRVGARPRARDARGPGEVARLLRRPADLGVHPPRAAAHPRHRPDVRPGRRPTGLRRDRRRQAGAAAGRRWAAGRVIAGQAIWIVGGGELVGQFDDAGLLDEIRLGVTPVTLGAGAPLLRPPDHLRADAPAQRRAAAARW